MIQSFFIFTIIYYFCFYNNHNYFFCLFNSVYIMYIHYVPKLKIQFFQNVFFKLYVSFYRNYYILLLIIISEYFTMSLINLKQFFLRKYIHFFLKIFTLKKYKFLVMSFSNSLCGLPGYMKQKIILNCQCAQNGIL